MSLKLVKLESNFNFYDHKAVFDFNERLHGFMLVRVFNGCFFH